MNRRQKSKEGTAALGNGLQGYCLYGAVDCALIYSNDDLLYAVAAGMAPGVRLCLVQQELVVLT